MQFGDEWHINEIIRLWGEWHINETCWGFNVEKMIKQQTCKREIGPTTC